MFHKRSYRRQTRSRFCLTVLSLVVLLVVVVPPSGAQAEQFAATVQSVVPQTTDDGIEFMIVTDGDTHYRQFELDGPPRLVVDFIDAENRLDFTNLPVDEGGVLRIRAAQFSDGQTSATRVVFDLETKRAYRVTAGESGAVRVGFPFEAPDLSSTLSGVPETHPESASLEDRLSVELVNGQVSVSAVEVPIAELLAELDAVAGTESLVRAGLAEYVVTVRFQDLPLGSAIRAILGPLPLDYAVIGGTRITVTGLSEPGVN